MIGTKKRMMDGRWLPADAPVGASTPPPAKRGRCINFRTSAGALDPS